MTNPLLRPNDPRFRQPEIRDAEGKNQYAENAAPPTDEAGGRGVFAAGAADEARPYQPQFGAQQHSRSGLLLLLALAGWTAAGFGAVSFTGVLSSGWIAPLLGVMPAACAWFMAYEERRAVDVGAIDITHRPQIKLTLWLGFTGLVACLSLVGSMIYRQMNFLPDVF